MILYVELKKMRNLNEEVDRMEKIKMQIVKCRDSEFRSAFYVDLDWYKEERGQFKKKMETILDKSNLYDDELILIKQYYLEGKTWGQAFGAVLEAFKDNPKRLARYGDDGEDALKMRALRKVQKYYNYYSKKK